MTPAEKQRFKGTFPSLDVNRAVVTDNATRVYNCISWTVGVTTAWIWPGPTLTGFDAFYARHGLHRTGSGPVAVWGINANQMTHGCISGPSHGPRWESKCGADLRIEHGLNELVGASYGRVLAFYSLTSRTQKQIASEKGNVKTAPKIKLNTSQRKALAAQVDRVARATREAFESRFRAWQEAWFSSPLTISSDPSARTHSVEFHNLVALGPSILPLIIEQMTDPSNFLALVLYDAIQPDRALIVQYDADDDRIELGEQGRAAEVVDVYLRST